MTSAGEEGHYSTSISLGDSENGELECIYKYSKTRPSVEKMVVDKFSSEYQIKDAKVDQYYDKYSPTEYHMTFKWDM